MEKETRTAKFFRQRKFLMVLPLLVTPFITVFFVLFGGGSSTGAPTSSTALNGFNQDIPSAVVDDRALDKMKYYELAEQEAAALLEQQKNDPYYTGTDRNEMISDSGMIAGYGTGGNVNTSVYAGKHANAPEDKVLERLEKLNAVLKAPDPVPAAPTVSYTNSGTAETGKDMEQLDAMMQRMQQSGDQEDPEMEQINGVLERILDIQHPERVQEQLRKTSEQRKGQVFAVTPYQDSQIVSSLSAPAHENSQPVISQSNGFYSLDDEQGLSAMQNAIEAVIHEAQVLTSGSTVKLRLLNDVFINGVRIPRDHFIFGTAALNGERLLVNIDHIRLDASVFPVTMSVHDMDGMSGIYIPGAITRDVMKQSGDQSLQGLGMMTMNPSLGVQAASAGIELGKNMLSKKIKLVKVQVKAGYKVLLLDEKQQRNND